MADLDLDAITQRAEAATPRPWSVADVEGSPFVRVDGILLHEVDFRLVEGGREQGFLDAEFIAHAREDVPALVAEVRRLTAELAEITSAGEPDLLDSITDAGDLRGRVRAVMRALRVIEAERDQARAALGEAEYVFRGVEALPSTYTRAPGVNGDRVADLLSSDCYRLGAEGRAIVARAAHAGGD